MNVSASLLLFKTKFHLSYGISRYRLIITLQLELDGIVGLGSGVFYACHPSRAYYDIKQILLPILRETKIDNLKEMRLRVANLFGKVDGGALYAADTLLWDLESKITRKPISNLLKFGKVNRKQVRVTEQVWAVPPHLLENELRPIILRGTTQIKVKLNMGDDYGLSNIKNINKICDNKMTLKIDPNGQFSNFGKAIDSLKTMEELGVEMVEDPLPPSFGYAKIKVLKSNLKYMKVMLDYNILSVNDIDRALEYDAFDIINIKLSRVGGITRALPLIERCESANKLVSVGCNEDVGPAMYGILHLSSVLSNYYGTEGVGWQRLKTRIIDKEPEIIKGVIDIPSDSIGIQPNSSFNLIGKFTKEEVVGRRSFMFRSQSVTSRGANLLSRVNHKLRNVIDPNRYSF